MTRTLSIILMVMVWLPGSPPARAQTARDMVAAVDVERIYLEAKAAKAFREKFDQQRAAEQDEFRTRERALIEADKELKRQQPILSADAFARKGQELTKKVAALQRDIRNRNKALEDRFDLGLSQIQAALIEVIREIAVRRELDLVVTARSVVLQDPVLDITDEALTRLDARLPEIPLDKL